jgi:hypothetical protein
MASNRLLNTKGDAMSLIEGVVMNIEGMDKEDIKENQEILDRLVNVVDGKNTRQAVPALMALLVHAVISSGSDHKEFLKYLTRVTTDSYNVLNSHSADGNKLH